MDANRKVYVYNTGGGLLGSWTAGTLACNATVEGIATNGTDVWIVDAKSDKVYKYSGAATRTSGTQYASSSFTLNSGNTSPKDIVTDGTSLWVVNDSTTDKVFKYSVSGSLMGSWTISSGGGSPTGITLDPANVSHLWIVDSATDRVYQYDGAASLTSGSQDAIHEFRARRRQHQPAGPRRSADGRFGADHCPDNDWRRRGLIHWVQRGVERRSGNLGVASAHRTAHPLSDSHRIAPASHNIDDFMSRLGTRVGTCPLGHECCGDDVDHHSAIDRAAKRHQL